MSDSTKTSYSLSRAWFDYCFENPELINPNHSALFFFAIEHCNRLGWKEKFGLPTTMAMEAIGIKSYNTYKKTLDQLIEMGFIIMIQKSKNQYSANIVALSKNNKALDKALDKAMIKHSTKQSESTIESNDSINKPITKNQEHITNYREIAERYRDAYKKQYPNFSNEIDRNYNEDTWCKEIDDLIRLDGHSRQDVIDVLMFALKDDFWSIQLRSLATLRKKGKNECKKFDNIKAKRLQVEACKPKSNQLSQAEQIKNKVYTENFG